MALSKITTESLLDGEITEAKLSSDFYEEGTWTPVLNGASTTTYSGQIGHYVKTGKLVFINGHIHINSLGDGSTSVMAGLPFTVDVAYSGGSGMTGYTLSHAVSTVSLSIMLGSNQTLIHVWGKTAAASGVTAQAVFGNGARLNFSAVYQIA
jgi:hypothetical protein